MKTSLTLALALAAIPLAASADYIERYYTSDGRLVERRYADEPRYDRPYSSDRYYYRDRAYVPSYPDRSVYYYSGGARDAAAVHTGGDSPGDQALAARIGEAMMADRRLDGVTATVSSSGGEVSISGSADRSGQSDRAQEIARRYAGFGHVTGGLETRGGN